jgi:hypothetical protein
VNHRLTCLKVPYLTSPSISYGPKVFLKEYFSFSRSDRKVVFSLCQVIYTIIGPLSPIIKENFKQNFTGNAFIPPANNVLLYLLFHVSVHLSTPIIDPSYFLVQLKLLASALPLNTSAYKSLTGFKVFFLR